MFRQKNNIIFKRTSGSRIFPGFLFASLLLVAFYLFAVNIYSCSESTAPDDNNGPDTTSHNFTWIIDTIGTRSSSLADVAIIDKNNIWAVGQIYTEEQTPYNAVHWNGQKWELYRIPAVTFWGTISKGPINAVFAFSSNNVWMFSDAGSYAHWNGKTWKSEFVSERNGSINKIWGSSSNNIYFVGNNGNITHYDGSIWQRLDSGTDIDIQDIWSDGDEILAVASYEYYGSGLSLMKIDGTTVTKLDTSGLRIAQSGIWFDAGKVYYIVGDGLFRKDNNINKEIWIKEEGHLLMYKAAIRGTDYKDIFVVGGYGLVSHYNGATWKHYTNIELPSFYGNWWSVAVKNNMVVAVGNIAGVRGLILRGYRN